MKLSVTQENLARALGVVGRVASNRAGLPILNNILFRTEGNRLLLAATNLEIAATYYIGAKVETPGGNHPAGKTCERICGEFAEGADRA